MTRAAGKRKRAREDAENVTPAESGAAAGPRSAPTQQGAKKRAYNSKGKEAARDAARGLKQVGIASFFGR